MVLPAARPPPRPESLFSGAPEPDDPLELLYARALAFEQGEPRITVRVAEGRDWAIVEPLGPYQVLARGPDGRSRLALSGEGGVLTLRLRDGRSGQGQSFVELASVRLGDKAALQAALEEWKARGIAPRVVPLGDVYGVAGHVVDTRHLALLAPGDGTEAQARELARTLSDRTGTRLQVHRELTGRPSGLVELRSGADPASQAPPLAVGHSVLELRCEAAVRVRSVEYGMGYSFHGTADRTYPGRLFGTADAAGKLAVVAAIPMERLVQGIVPSEIFANAPVEALKAQAVTARGEVLAKIGARHLGDPYLLCSEQHCQSYRGVSAERPGPSAAVAATRGEALFARREGQARLVDSVYSAVCGGFTEDNDVIWGSPKDPSLRGRPDFDPKLAPEFAQGIGEALVGRFVRARPPIYCGSSSFARPDKLRWTRTFSAPELDEACAGLGVGRVLSLAVLGRGISGRARALQVTGERGTATVHGELPIRRLLKNLNSALFMVERTPAGWVFTGAGWGHGGGMCQTGAIGRALAGASHRDILGWYYSGATPEKIY